MDITGGKLLNSPAISFITQIHSHLHKINDGDLFISSDKEDIYEAIQKGAFCIITNQKLDIIDNEIAWIYVDDIDLAIIKIIRYLLANKTINAYYTDSILYEFLKLYNPNKNNYLFLDTPKNDIEQISLIENGASIISYNEKILKSIYPNAMHYKIKKFNISNLTIHSLFETTFSFQEKLYSKIKLCASYIDYFLSMQEFYNFEKVDENKLKYINCMQAIFLNKSLQIVDFGKSNRFILTSSNEQKYMIDKNFLHEFYTYGKIDMVDVENFDDATIYNILKNSKANCLYLNHCNKSKIKTILDKFSLHLDTLL